MPDHLRWDPGASLLTRCIARRDGQRGIWLEMGLVGLQVCSLGGIGEPANPPKLLETLRFLV